MAELPTPRFESRSESLLVGMNASYSHTNKAGIPAQWQRFATFLGRIPGQVENVAYGVVHNTDDSGKLEYFCGVEIREAKNVPKELTTLSVPPQHYAVFEHSGHISTIENTFDVIWNSWAPTSGYAVVSAPILEVYGPQFDSNSGSGGIEIWLPVKR